MGFVLDRMLGRLTKWLRILGCDAIYVKGLSEREIEDLLSQGRMFLTRDRKAIKRFSPCFLISSEKLQGQIREMKEKGLISLSRDEWFTRCILCNNILKSPPPETIRQNVPDYILSQNLYNLKYCPQCKKCYWPGTHRTNIIKTLNSWGF